MAKIVSAKMIRRHPHVFSGVTYKTREDQHDAWEKIKAKEKEIENLKRIAEKNNKNMQATIKLLVEKGIPQEIIDSIKNM